MSIKLTHSISAKKIVLSDLVSVKTLQRIQDNLANALGISLIIIGSVDRQPVTRRSNMSSFCDIMQGYPEFKNNCSMAGAECGEKCLLSKKSSIYKCHAGLYGFTVPILVNGIIVSYFMGGQVRLSNPDLSACKNNAEKHNVSFDSYLEAYLAVPLFSQNKLDAVVELLSVVASTISNLALSGELAKSKATELVHLNDLLEKEVMRKTDELRISEERYRSIFDNALDVIYTIDANGILININNVVTRLLGYGKDEVLGQSFGGFIHQDDLKIVHKSFEDLKLRRRTTTKGLRFRLKAKDGHSVCFELNSRATYDEDGDLITIDGILRNIDRSLEAESDLRKAKEKYKELFDSMRDGVYMTDEAGYVRAFNKGALRILGYNNVSEIIGKPITDIYVNPDDRKQFLQELSVSGFIEGYTVKLKKKDGTPVYIEATSNELRDKDGVLKGVEGVFKDVTDKVRLKKENELIRQYTEDMIEHAGYGIIGVDLNRKVFVWNKDAEEIFGHSASEAIGRDVAALIPRDWREHRADLIKEVEKGEIVRGVKARRTLESGRMINISLTLSPIKARDGRVVGVSVIAEKEM